MHTVTIAFSLTLAALLAAVAAALPATGTVTSISSFSVPREPSGLYFHAAHNLLYVLCGTSTNGDHYLYAYTTGGAQRCFITIPTAVGMTRVDGFQISGTTAYIVDSQGPLYADRLGGSMYAVEWTNPCGCGADGTCTSSTVTWSPTITKKYTINPTVASIADGGGVDNTFRNSGVALLGDSFFAVNGVHPAGAPGDLSCCYPKSIVKMPLSGTGSVATQKWSFTSSTVGRAVDMEGLTCGSDNCAEYLYIGDEYNYIYKLRLSTADAAAAVVTEYSLRSIVTSNVADKGIEALTYAPTTGYFYAGIQQTATIHVVQLSDSGTAAGTGTTAAGATTTTVAGATTTVSPLGTTSSRSGAQGIVVMGVSGCIALVVAIASASLF